MRARAAEQLGAVVCSSDPSPDSSDAHGARRVPRGTSMAETGEHVGPRRRSGFRDRLLAIRPRARSRGDAAHAARRRRSGPPRQFRRERGGRGGHLGVGHVSEALDQLVHRRSMAAASPGVRGREANGPRREPSRLTTLERRGLVTLTGRRPTRSNTDGVIAELEQRDHLLGQRCSGRRGAHPPADLGGLGDPGATLLELASGERQRVHEETVALHAERREGLSACSSDQRCQALDRVEIACRPGPPAAGAWRATNRIIGSSSCSARSSALRDMLSISPNGIAWRDPTTQAVISRTSSMRGSSSSSASASTCSKRRSAVTLGREKDDHRRCRTEQLDPLRSPVGEVVERFGQS